MIWRVLFLLLARLPLGAAQALGALTAGVAYRLANRFRVRTDANLAQAGYSALCKSAVAHAGRQVFEWPYVWTRSAAQTRALVTTDASWAVFEAAKARGKGVILLTPHLGCFEICGQYMAQATTLTVMYRPHPNPAVNALLDRARTPHYQQLAPANLSGVRMLAKALKRGETVGILPDHVPRDGEGVWAPFFGKPAYTTLLPVKLQMMSGAAVVLLFAERLAQADEGNAKGAAFKLHAHELTEPFINSSDSSDSPSTPEQQATQLNAAMERMIALCPEQYFWSYDRWRGDPEKI
jgi:Kdo2-lipid IVA lauroyltransferase/acyltransferase